MKRSQNIDLGRMRKPSKAKFILRPAVLAVSAVMLAACSEPEDDAIVIYSVDDCSKQTSLDQQECETVYQNAQAEAERTGPKYNSQADCEAEFGPAQCRSNSSGMFSPLMAGFLMGRMMDIGRPSAVYQYNNPSSRYHNQIMTADGRNLGAAGQRSYKVPQSTYKAKPTVTKTVSRGGFGSSASAKSSWGSSKSSKSSGWGG
ncbi:DUF1190 domain-containing protein [Alginatibacterium sediminis]|uniref:DUF1190 domain-containing protein n=1 Tax=Alginatibacterium sediminis TaxID=2164068 RepID=A0A420E8X8_9ALTE|nr:DUF1190 domain-containing protein [Alginatibacterium sediminis]RKF15837.1 DUF1190 domain-containing protein [Alginatibacterium sediminis]